MLNEKTHTRIYNAGNLLSFTLNPSDDAQCYGSENRFNNFRNKMHQKFMDILDSDLCPYWARVELSEPVNEIKYPGPRLHLHGFIKLRTEESVFKFLCDGVFGLVTIGILKVNTVRNQSMLDGWLRYCEKQTAMFKHKCALVTSVQSITLPKEIFTIEGEMIIFEESPVRAETIVSATDEEGDSAPLPQAEEGAGGFGVAGHQMSRPDQPLLAYQKKQQRNFKKNYRK